MSFLIDNFVVKYKGISPTESEYWGMGIGGLGRE